MKIEEIAQKTGLSITTVSRFFNHPELLSEKTYKKIAKSTQESSDSLIDEGATLVGLIVPNLHLSFYAEFVNQLIQQGSKRGYTFIIHISEESPEEELALIENMLSYHIKSLVILSHILSSHQIEEISVPVIAVERKGGNFKQINNDNFAGGTLVAEHLKQSGCDVFIHLNDNDDPQIPAFKRLLAFKYAVENEINEIIIEKSLSSGDKTLISNILSPLIDKLLETYPTQNIGVFCSNDDLAHSFTVECVKKQIKIPDVFQIVGYDNSPISDKSFLPITSIDQNIQLLATITLDSIKNHTTIESIIPAKLLVKSTTFSS
ncbi:MAG: LacI family DNA-binding transcriptional regulator [Eubacteriales bacterium]